MLCVQVTFLKGSYLPEKRSLAAIFDGGKHVVALVASPNQPAEYQGRVGEWERFAISQVVNTREDGKADDEADYLTSFVHSQLALTKKALRCRGGPEMPPPCRSDPRFVRCAADSSSSHLDPRMWAVINFLESSGLLRGYPGPGSTADPKKYQKRFRGKLLLAVLGFGKLVRDAAAAGDPEVGCLPSFPWV